MKNLKKRDYNFLQRAENCIVILVQIAVSFPFRIFWRLFASFEVEGLANLEVVDRKRGVILAANHNSQLTTITLPTSLPYFSKAWWRTMPVYFVSLDKSGYKRFPIGRYIYGGFLFRLLGGRAIKTGLRDYESTLAMHIKLLSEGKTVCIYPEGRVIQGKALGEARGGVAYLAMRTGAPIMPVATMGDEDITFKKFFFSRPKFKVVFGHPIYYPYIDEPDLPVETRYHTSAQKIMRAIGEMQNKY